MPVICVRFSGRVLVNMHPLRCPGRGAGDFPRVLTLTSCGGTVTATCGERHRSPGGTDKKAACLWTVEGLTPSMLAQLAAFEPGRIRARLTGGTVLEGKLRAEPGTTSRIARRVGGRKA